jgi:hypothetical protein
MAAYRLPRPGDLLTVRSTDPYLDEAHVVVETVADNGRYLLLAGTWGEHELEVVLRRVGEHHPQQLET